MNHGVKESRQEGAVNPTGPNWLNSNPPTVKYWQGKKIERITNI